MTTTRKTLTWDNNTKSWVEVKSHKPYDGRWWGFTTAAVLPLALIVGPWLELSVWEILAVWAAVGWYAGLVQERDR